MEVSSVQHAALHRLLDVLSLELELLQGCVQVLRAEITRKINTTSNYSRPATCQIEGILIYQQLLGGNPA